MTTSTKSAQKNDPNLVDLNTKTSNQKTDEIVKTTGEEKPGESKTSVSSGTLTKDEIRTAIRTESAKYKYCYEKELQKNPSLEGSVKVKFIISATGQVISVTVPESFDQKVSGCIVEIIKNLEFPKPKGGIVVVKYPFNFVKKKKIEP